MLSDTHVLGIQEALLFSSEELGVLGGGVAELVLLCSRGSMPSAIDVKFNCDLHKKNWVVM